MHGAHVARRVNDGLHGNVGNAERQHGKRMAVHDGHDFRIGFVRAAMDEALDVGPVLAPVGGLAVEAEGHDVFGLDHLGAARTRQQEEVGIVRMAHADMAERVDDALVGEDPVGGDEFADDLVEIGHGRFL